MSEFWLKKPAILFSDGCNFNPFSNGTLNEKLNTYTRFTIITVLVLYCLTQESKYLIGGLIVITLIVLYYLMYKKDNYENIHFDNLLKEEQKHFDNLLKEEQKPLRKSDNFNTKEKSNNPLKNVQITDYGKDQVYSKSDDDIKMNKFINNKFFRTQSDFIFDKGTRQYYTMPNTSVPNKQGEFANWLYGTEDNCKMGSVYSRRAGQAVENKNCTRFDVSTPTNFGTL